jgi:hypothetical protein
VATATKLEIRAGDTKVYTDTITDTVTGDPITADLEAGGWEAICQIRVDYAVTSAVVAEFSCEITGPNEVTRTLYEVESLALDEVAFTGAATGKRKVYWDAQLRLPDGLAAGQDYVITYQSGTIDILGQVSRDAS